MPAPRALPALGPTTMAVAMVLAVAPAAATGVRASPVQGAVFLFDGRGHGHGVGMAQDSAQAMALAGVRYEDILGHFYPGTGRGGQRGQVRVDIWESGAATGAVTVTVPQGATLSDGRRSTAAPAGAQLQVTADAAGYHVRSVTRPAAADAMRSGLIGPSPSPSGPVPVVLPTATPQPSGGPLATASPSRPPSRGPTPGPSGPGSTPQATAAPRPSPTTSAAVAFDSTSPITVSPPAGGWTEVAATGEAYRGNLLMLARSGFRVVNVLDVEDYLRGMGEVPGSWPRAAVQTQAVAARTYALRAVGGSTPLGYDLCADTRCQVYLGMHAESPGTDAAVASTRGEVITYSGTLADAFYSANAGGLTATPAEGFGSGASRPYLPGGVPAPGDPAHWQVPAAPADVAHRLGYPGQLTGLTVLQRGPSGRVTQLQLTGSAGSRVLAGTQAAGNLGLWSTLFTVTLTTGQARPLPAPAVSVQLPPAQLAEQLAPVLAAVPTPSPSSPPAVDVRAARAHTTVQWPLDVVAALLIAAATGGQLVTRHRRRRQR